MAKKRPTRPVGSGARRFLRDSGAIHKEIRKAKNVLVKARSEDEQHNAIDKIESAEANLRALSKARFEKIAEERTATALRAMDNLIKLTTQNRYAIILTREHAAAIIGELQARFESVSRALTATVESQAARQTVGVFVGVSMFQRVGGQAAE